jgi:hypothetical protein
MVALWVIIIGGSLWATRKSSREDRKELLDLSIWLTLSVVPFVNIVVLVLFAGVMLYVLAQVIMEKVLL